MVVEKYGRATTKVSIVRKINIPRTFLLNSQPFECSSDFFPSKLSTGLKATPTMAKQPHRYTFASISIAKRCPVTKTHALVVLFTVIRSGSSCHSYCIFHIVAYCVSRAHNVQPIQLPLLCKRYVWKKTECHNTTTTFCCSVKSCFWISWLVVEIAVRADAFTNIVVKIQRQSNRIEPVFQIRIAARPTVYRTCWFRIYERERCASTANNPCSYLSKIVLNTASFIHQNVINHPLPSTNIRHPF